MPNGHMEFEPIDCSDRSLEIGESTIAVRQEESHAAVQQLRRTK